MKGIFSSDNSTRPKSVVNWLWFTEKRCAGWYVVKETCLSKIFKQKWALLFQNSTFHDYLKGLDWVTKCTFQFSSHTHTQTFTGMWCQRSAGRMRSLFCWPTWFRGARVSRAVCDASLWFPDKVGRRCAPLYRAPWFPFVLRSGSRCRCALVPCTVAWLFALVRFSTQIGPATNQATCFLLRMWQEVKIIRMNIAKVPTV